MYWGVLFPRNTDSIWHLNHYTFYGWEPHSPCPCPCPCPCPWPWPSPWPCPLAPNTHYGEAVVTHSLHLQFNAVHLSEPHLVDMLGGHLQGQMPPQEGAVVLQAGLEAPYSVVGAGVRQVLLNTLTLQHLVSVIGTFTLTVYSTLYMCVYVYIIYMLYKYG